MTLKQKLTNFFQANPNLSKESGTLYSAYKVKKYTYDEVQKRHNLTVVAKDPNSKNQNNYQLERIGDLHPDLIKCLQEKEEIVYFWTGDKLEASDPFFLEGGGYYWTVFPKRYLIEKQKAQEWLDKYYPKEKRGEIEKLEISGIKTKTIGWKLLEGHLDLQDFANLKYLDCSDNLLTSLNIGNCLQLQELYCSNNKLTNVEQILSPLNPEKLKNLDLSFNCFSKQNLSIFSKFVNLEFLDISNNFFTGSLEFSQDLINLKELNIINTNIDSGLKFLPDNLKAFRCYDPDYARDSFKSTNLYKKELRSFNGNFKVWKDFYKSPAREWLDKEYPEGEEYQDENPEENLYLDILTEEENTNKQRKEITELDISNKNLKGPLKLKGFTNLKRLNCSKNQLTNLDLSDCSSLIELDCFNNDFSDLEFLKSVPKLKKLSVANNQKLAPQDLRDLRTLLSFTDLEDLDINNCSFKGSLKILENLNNLKWLNISNTNISEGLEYLPKSCETLYCNSDYQYKSIKIMEELDKSNCWDEKGGHKYYVPAKWREFKEDGRVALVIPLERLYVIRGNIRKFINKWGKEAEESWYERFVANSKSEGEKESKANELSNLQSPKEFGIYRYTKSAKWIARAGAVSGGVLALTDNSAIGGAFATIFPFVEILASNAEEELYAAKQKKWDEFISDVENLLDNYHELLGILEQVKKSKLGTVNQALNDLRKKVKAFLKEYDQEDESGKKNGVIDLLELINKKKELGADLSNEESEGGGSQLGNIVLAVKKLEEEVIAYRQGSDKKEMEDKSEENQEDNSQKGSSCFDDRSSAPILNDQGYDEENSFLNIELEEISNQERLETQIEIPPK